MMFSFVAVLIMAVFLVQLVLCFRARRRLVRVLPLALLVLTGLICGAGFAGALLLERAGRDIHGAAFAAVIYGYMVLVALFVDGIAWAIFGFVRFIQKDRK